MDISDKALFFFINVVIGVLIGLFVIYVVKKPKKSKITYAISAVLIFIIALQLASKSSFFQVVKPTSNKIYQTAPSAPSK